MDLAQRSLTSVSWNLGATLGRFAILLVRAVLLARWLPVETFGVYGLAGAVVGLSLVLPEFGLSGEHIATPFPADVIDFAVGQHR